VLLFLTGEEEIEDACKKITKEVRRPPGALAAGCCLPACLLLAGWLAEAGWLAAGWLLPGGGWLGPAAAAWWWLAGGGGGWLGLLLVAGASQWWLPVAVSIPQHSWRPASQHSCQPERQRSLH
jgi:hypothetical protein